MSISRSGPRVSAIKHAQKEKLFFKELSSLLLQLMHDDPRLKGIILNRVKLSADKSLCTAYFYMPEGKKAFDEILELLKLYRPSLRKAISDTIKARHTPDLRFLFDESYEKQERLDALLLGSKNDR